MRCSFGLQQFPRPTILLELARISKRSESDSPMPQSINECVQLLASGLCQMNSFARSPIFATIFSTLLVGAANAQSNSEDGVSIADGAAAAGLEAAAEPAARWVGNVRVADGVTLVGIPDGPILPVAGLDLPAPGLQCPVGPGEPTCREAAESALIQLTEDAEVTCEQNYSEFDTGYICSAGGIDVASRMVELGLAIGIYEQLWPIEEEARANAVGMWASWSPDFPAEFPPPTFDAQPMDIPGHEASEACALALSTAWDKKDYELMATIEAAALFVDELRFRWELTAGLDFMGEDLIVDDETAEAFQAIEDYCGSLNDGSSRPVVALPIDGDLEAVDALLSSVADQARETCWQSGFHAVKKREFNRLVELTQIMNFVAFETGTFFGDYWVASQNEDEDSARQALGKALAVFDNAIKLCESHLAE